MVKPTFFKPIGHRRLFMIAKKIGFLLGAFIVVSYGWVADSGGDFLTREERDWLNKHSGKIRMAPSPGWEPMEIIKENGEYKGLVADYIRLIEDRLGFKFTIVKAKTWYEVLQMAKNRKIDVISAAYDTPERRKFMIWSEPYLEVPEVIVTRKSWEGELTLDDMKGMRVGVTLAYVVADWIKNNHPEVPLIYVPNDLVGLRMVSFGELDAMIAELPIASYAIEKEKITNLRVAGQTGYSAVLSIGVRNDWPILARIMQKGLALISRAEKEAIYKRWINLGDFPFYYSQRFWYWTIIALVAVAGGAAAVFIWNMTLRNKVNDKTMALTQELNERKRIETALRDSETRLATLIGNLPGMAYRHHIESEDRWPMDYISSGCQELTGYEDLCKPGSETEFFDKVVHPEDKAKIRRTIKGALSRQEPFRLTYRIVTAQGNIKWVWEQGVGIYSESDDVIQVEGFVTDISSFKQAEEALTRSRQLFQDLVLNSLIGISIIQDGRIVFQNPEQKRIFGCLPNDFDILECANIHPDDTIKVKGFLSVAEAGDEKPSELDFRLFPYGSNGLETKCRWIHCRVSRIEYEGRKSLLLNMLDVTHARELEQFLSVQDKMASLGRVAAGIAHEIRNPLSGINLHLGAIDRLRRHTVDMSQIHESLKQVKKASHSIESVIRRVMDFAKPGAPRFKPLDINDPVKQAIQLCAVALRKIGVQLTVNLTSEPLLCRADSNLIQRVLLNLVTNAAEALENVSGEKNIIVTSSKMGDQAVIRVADSGPGVSEFNAERIFEPFYTTKKDGTGIGLSLSRRIAMDHLGALVVKQNPSGGAVFVLSVPLIKEAP